MQVQKPKALSCALVFSGYVLLFSAAMCTSQCKLRHLRANAQLSALLYKLSRNFLHVIRELVLWFDQLFLDKWYEE